MAQVSSPLIAYLKEKPTGSTTGFEPNHLYLMRFPRGWSAPIAGLSMRAPVGAGTVVLTLISDGPPPDQMGEPNEVLFKTELNVPAGKDSAGYASLAVMFPEPFLYFDNFWLGFQFSDPVEVPTRLPVFNGKRTAAKMDFAKLSGSLLNTPMELLTNDDKLGAPILFPIITDVPQGVEHGA